MHSTVASSTLHSSFRVSFELFLLLASNDLTVRMSKSVDFVAHAILFDFDARDVLDDPSGNNLRELSLLIWFSVDEVVGTERRSARRDSKVGTHVNRTRYDHVIFKVSASNQWLLLAVAEHVYTIAIVTNNVLLHFAGDLDVTSINLIIGQS